MCRIKRKIEFVTEVSGSHSELSRQQTCWSESHLRKRIFKRCGFVLECSETHRDAIQVSVAPGCGSGSAEKSGRNKK